MGRKRSLQIINNLLHPMIWLAICNSSNLVGGNDPASPILADNFPHRGAIDCAIRAQIAPDEFHNFLRLRLNSCQVAKCLHPADSQQLRLQGPVVHLWPCSLRNICHPPASGASSDNFQVLCPNYGQLLARAIMLRPQRFQFLAECLRGGLVQR